MYPVPKHVYESPVQGITGLWGGVGGTLLSGSGAPAYDWDHIKFSAPSTVFSSAYPNAGPPLAEIKSGLSSPTGDDLSFKDDTNNMNYNSGVIVLRIPKTDDYKIKIRGADACPAWVQNTSSTNGIPAIGAGAEVYGTFTFAADTILGIIMGLTPPGLDTSTSGSAGGGGSFVWTTDAITGSNGFGSNTLWLAAGGGGGWGHGPPAAQGGQAPHNSVQMAPGGGTGSGSGPYSPGPSGSQNAGGGGRGGGPPTQYGNGGGGAGWLGYGGDSTSGTEGGHWSSNGQLKGGSGGNQYGGWGGGGGATGSGVPGGGGGGYSGGDGGNGWSGSVWGGGAGGGSYTNPQASSPGGTTNQRLGPGQAGQNGYIQIEKV